MGIGKDFGIFRELVEVRCMHGFVPHIADGFGMLTIRQNPYNVFYVFHKPLLLSKQWFNDF